MPRFVSDTRELSHQDSSPPNSNPCAPVAPPAERMLEALCRAPIEHGADAAGQFMLETFAAILPGIVFAINPGGCSADESFIATAETELRQLPDGTLKLFAAFGSERLLPLDDGAGSTLHCASNDAALEADDTSLGRVLKLAAEALAAALRNARALDAERRKMRELQQVQASLVQTEKLASLGQISAGVVHELSNPLTSIATYSEFLLRKAQRDGGAPDDIERLRRISESADRIHNFARALVSYARPAEQCPVPVDVNTVLDRALIFCEHMINESRVAVTCVIPDSVPPARGVQGQLIQVFVNLIANACQAMAASGGCLSISAATEECDKMLVVTVRDSGAGILAEHLPRIFEPFFTTKDNNQGTGLGLSVVRYIVDAHGGKITAESPAGHGAVFTVRLPTA
jgi:two-component system, NtrC family, sensor kinase